MTTILFCHILLNANLANAFVFSRAILWVWTSSDCIIWSVDDGDTFDLFCSWWVMIPNVRLAWVNAPDFDSKLKIGKCYYDESKNFIRAISKREVKADFLWSDLCKDSDKWCRNLVRLIDLKTWIDLNEMLIKQWYAFSWIQFSILPENLKITYLKAELEARRAKRWLWNKCEVDYFWNQLVDSGIPSKMTH